MSSKFLFCLVLIVLSINTTTFAQYKPNSLANGILPDVIPSSPEASSLGKFGQWPVSQYTGLPSISVPIFNVSISGFQLPVQLSYHAGGVKLDEVASWVGTGWALNAGGVINRTIVGLPDETNPGGFLYRNLSGNGLKESYDLSNVDDYIFFRKIDDRLIDAEPDIFNFNFGGFSGKFYFDKTGKFQCIPVNSLKLLRCPLNNTLNYTDQHWEIADPNGNIFFFASYQDNDNGFEKTKIFTPDAQGALPYQVSAWYLTKIVLANNADVIYFDYDTKSESYDLPNNYSLKTKTGYYGDVDLLGTGVNLRTDEILVNGGGGNSSSLSTSGKSQLKKIRWSNGEIVFDANTSRSDLSGGKTLDVITVNNKEGIRINQFALNYNYVQQRYFLTSVVESGNDASVQLKHVFEYIQPESLPLRSESLAQDHWGYYNGANSNTHLLSPVPEMNNASINANREPNETYMQYGALSKITYPTGGYTLFDYEAHRYDPTSPIGRDNPPAQIVNATISLKAGEPQPSGFNRVQTFNIPITQNTAAISIQFTNYNKPPSKELAKLPLIKIEKLVNASYQPVYYWDAYDKFPVGNVTQNGNGYVDFNINESISFDPGDYRITTDVVCGVSNCGTPSINPAVAATFTYASSNGQLPIAGGLRIKKITNYSEGNFANAKKFTYTPGKLLLYPKYLHQYSVDVSSSRYCAINPPGPGVGGCGICTQLYHNYKEVTSSSQVILGVTQGSIVGYTYVKEQDVDANENDNGFTDYTFDFTPDGLNIINYDNSYWTGLLNSSIPLNNLDYKRGALLFKEAYKKTPTGAYIKIHSLRNVYQYNDNNTDNRFNSLRGLRVNYIKRAGSYCANYDHGYPVPSSYPFKPDFTYGFYDIITSWVQSTLTEETVYDANGQNPMRTTTNYSYNNPTHLQVTSSSIIDSKGNTILTENKYPSDYAATSPTSPNVYNGMIDKNMIAPVIDQKSSIGTSILSETKTDFLYWQTNSIIKPSAVSSSVKGNSLETRITFNSYDSKGNILEQQKTNDVKAVYLWGYNLQYPVAKVIGSDYNTVNTVVSQSQIDANTSNDANLRLILNALRTDSRTSKALVTTYTYAPLIGMTSETDPNGKTIFYEYDTFNRLKNIKDYQGNIIKNFQYNYQNSCGNNCVVLPMQTYSGSNTIGYPVGVFNVNGQLLGNATSQSQYISLWNSNTANQAKGVLSAGTDALHFNLAMVTGQTAPTGVMGLRYYQVDLPYTQLDGIRNSNGVYVDFGDGTGMMLGKTQTDINVTLAPNTTMNFFPLSDPFDAHDVPYFIHTWPNSNTKTLTFYHNDGVFEKTAFDNMNNPATGLTKLTNLRGNIPQFTNLLSGSCYQQASMNSVANITNWSTINSITSFGTSNGDGLNPCLNLNYAQDFMANNKGLQVISTQPYGIYRSGYIDASFKISRLKSDWPTYFTELRTLNIREDQWDHENLSNFKKLSLFLLSSTTQDHTDNTVNNPVIPIAQSVIDNAINQIASGAGNAGVRNGAINIRSGGTPRGTASDAAVSQLKALGWLIYMNSVAE